MILNDIKISTAFHFYLDWDLDWLSICHVYNACHLQHLGHMCKNSQVFSAIKNLIILMTGLSIQ